MHTYIYSYTHTFIHTYLLTSKHIYIDINIYSFTYPAFVCLFYSFTSLTHTHIHIYIYTHIYIHACIHTYMLLDESYGACRCSAATFACKLVFCFYKISNMCTRWLLFFLSLSPAYDRGVVDGAV